VVEAGSLGDPTRGVLAARELAQDPLDAILTLPWPLSAGTRSRLRGRLGSGFRDDRRRRRISVPCVARGAHHNWLTAAWAHDLETAPAASRATNGTVAAGALDLNQIIRIN
jgi:hypothetical protein